VKYSIIYADPPWTYMDKASAGNRGAFYKYDLMDDNDIYSIPVSEIADDDCILFIWATFPKIAEALETIKAWGFTYKTVAFTWVKTNKKSDSLFWGMGRWTRSNAEVCLLATKGKPKRINAGVHSVVMSPIGRHSAKPAEVRDRIVSLVGDLPRIELFARSASDGWDVWGNEIEPTVYLDTSDPLEPFKTTTRGTVTLPSKGYPAKLSYPVCM
jgi:N6-adenosine-specific RNA methylase IME4